jgi:hypothetical protein
MVWMEKNIEAAHMNNGDIINDDVILSLEDERDLMKKTRSMLYEGGGGEEVAASTTLF